MLTLQSPTIRSVETTTATKPVEAFTQHQPEVRIIPIRETEQGNGSGRSVEIGRIGPENSSNRSIEIGRAGPGLNVGGVTPQTQREIYRGYAKTLERPIDGPSQIERIGPGSGNDRAALIGQARPATETSTTITKVGSDTNTTMRATTETGTTTVHAGSDANITMREGNGSDGINGSAASEVKVLTAGSASEVKVLTAEPASEVRVRAAGSASEVKVLTAEPAGEVRVRAAEPVSEVKLLTAEPEANALPAGRADDVTISALDAQIDQQITLDTLNGRDREPGQLRIEGRSDQQAALDTLQTDPSFIKQIMDARQFAEQTREASKRDDLEMREPNRGTEPVETHRALELGEPNWHTIPGETRGELEVKELNGSTAPIEAHSERFIEDQPTTPRHVVGDGDVPQVMPGNANPEIAPRPDEATTISLASMREYSVKNGPDTEAEAQLEKNVSVVSNEELNYLVQYNVNVTEPGNTSVSEQNTSVSDPISNVLPASGSAHNASQSPAQETSVAPQQSTSTIGVDFAALEKELNVEHLVEKMREREASSGNGNGNNGNDNRGGGGGGGGGGGRGGEGNEDGESFDAQKLGFLFLKVIQEQRDAIKERWQKQNAEFDQKLKDWKAILSGPHTPETLIKIAVEGLAEARKVELRSEMLANEALLNAHRSATLHEENAQRVNLDVTKRDERGVISDASAIGEKMGFGKDPKIFYEKVAGPILEQMRDAERSGGTAMAGGASGIGKSLDQIAASMDYFGRQHGFLDMYKYKEDKISSSKWKHHESAVDALNRGREDEKKILETGYKQAQALKDFAVKLMIEAREMKAEDRKERQLALSRRMYIINALLAAVGGFGNVFSSVNSTVGSVASNTIQAASR